MHLVPSLMTPRALHDLYARVPCMDVCPAHVLTSTCARRGSAMLAQIPVYHGQYYQCTLLT